jgi:RNA 3'-terminal phosphate cyclase (ATP)
LKPQHLESVLTAAKLCNAELRGAELESRELWFKPKAIRGGQLKAEIGTAGSIPMLILTVLPICLMAQETVHLQVTKGGTDTSHAPTINYLRSVFLKALKCMGADAELSVQRYGYYPKGNGEATLTVRPMSELKSFVSEEFGKISNLKGVSVCTFLADRKVAERQANAAIKTLEQKGYKIANVEIVNDTSNPVQKGSSIALWAESNMGAFVGADAIGELHKLAETVGEEAAEKLAVELASEATVDVHLADMLIPYMAMAKRPSAYLTRTCTEHIEANIWLAEKMLNSKFAVKQVGELFRVEKLAET